MPDPKYKDQTIAKFINIMMLDGKKSVSEKIMYGALDIIKDRGKDDPVEIFNVALENVSPGVEVKSRRVGGDLCAGSLKWSGTYAYGRQPCSYCQSVACRSR